jgi:O-methyltransferase involved in polyketide biosynthesis
MVKAQTKLPYARAAAVALWGSGAVTSAEQAAASTPGAEQRRAHFEMRARSVDHALENLGATRVLEIAAGLSFRSLAMAERTGVFYLDTDLSEMAAIKAELVPRLHPAPLAGTLRVQALDALDADAFAAAVASMPDGRITVAHEGLLMYLDDAEKTRLASNIRQALAVRGGAWVTADVYVRSERHLLREEHIQKFLADHRVEERKFADWDAAEAFFTTAGFRIDDRIAREDDPWQVRQTWLLTVAGVSGA